MDTRAYRPSATQDAEYEWLTDRQDYGTRDMEEVERRIVKYTAHYANIPPEDPVEESDEYEECMVGLLTTDWAWTVGQLRQGCDVVFERLLEMENGYQVESPF